MWGNSGRCHVRYEYNATWPVLPNVSSAGFRLVSTTAYLTYLAYQDEALAVQSTSRLCCQRRAHASSNTATVLPKPPRAGRSPPPHHTWDDGAAIPTVRCIALPVNDAVRLVVISGPWSESWQRGLLHSQLCTCIIITITIIILFFFPLLSPFSPPLPRFLLQQAWKMNK